MTKTKNTHIQKLILWKIQVFFLSKKAQFFFKKKANIYKIRNDMQDTILE